MDEGERLQSTKVHAAPRQEVSRAGTAVHRGGEEARTDSQGMGHASLANVCKRLNSVVSGYPCRTPVPKTGRRRLPLKRCVVKPPPRSSVGVSGFAPNT